MSKSKIVKFEFQFEGKSIRVVTTKNGEPTWIANDACKILGLSNTTEALRSLDADEKGRYTELITDPSKPESGAIPRTYATVTEPGLYVLILKSQKPEAKRFQRYLTHEILPQIRKTGYFVQVGDEERVRDELDRILRDRALPWQQLWSCELPKALEKVCPAWKRTGHYGVPPTVMLDIYHRVIGKKAVDEARRRRDVQGVQTIHQLLQDDVRAKFRDKIEAVIAIARISRSYEDFQAKLFAGIGGAMLQLNLVEESEVCPVCGAKPYDGASFCHKCGKRLAA